MSRPSSASIAAATNSSPPAAVDTSHTSGTQSLPTMFAASLIRVSSRPQMATRTPAADNDVAAARPSPLDAPATAARRPAIPRSMPLNVVRLHAAACKVLAETGGKRVMDDAPIDEFHLDAIADAD